MPRFDLCMITTVEADTFEKACDCLRDWADATAGQNEIPITSKYPGMAALLSGGQRIFVLHPLHTESEYGGDSCLVDEEF